MVTEFTVDEDLGRPRYMLRNNRPNSLGYIETKSGEYIFAGRYFRERIFSREDIFVGRYFRVNSIFAKISSRENISNSLFAKFSSRENKVYSNITQSRIA